MNEVFKFWIIVILTAIVIGALSIILMKKFKGNPLAKYIPTLLIWLSSITLYIIGRFFAQPMQDLGYYIMSMITGLITLISLIVLIVLERMPDRKKKKRKK